MPRIFRGLGVSFALWWALLPQFACFLPPDTPSQAESDCCKQMKGQCGETGMQDHKCCGESRRPDIPTIAKTFREAAPDIVIAAPTKSFEAISAPSSAIAGGFLNGDIHAPPHDPPGLSLILRI